MSAKNEVTGKKAREIAGRILRMVGVDDGNIYHVTDNMVVLLCSASDLRALAASALTQAPDKKDVKVR